MECENSLCIYESDRKCILEKISVNMLGICDDCIYPSIDDEVLNSLKEKTLKRLEDDNKICESLNSQ